MTRLKELRRIENAIENQNATELHWALGYCKMRLSISARQEHIKYWEQIETKVIQALETST